MPIKGLKTRSAVLGNIKVGARKKVNTRHGPRVIPVKFNHFVVTTTEQDELGYLEDEALMRKLLHEQLQMAIREHTEHIYNNAGDLVKTVQNVDTKTLESQNEKLTRILVALRFDDPDENLVTSLAVYDREGCRCRGDGEIADWTDPKNGQYHKVACPCQMLQFRLHPDDDPDARHEHEKKDRGMWPNDEKGFVCKANGILRVKIAAARTLGGVHLFRTTSMHSITQLLSAMHEISSLTGGILAGIPLHLEVAPKRVAAGFGKKPQIVPVVNLTCKADEVEFLRELVEHTALRERMRHQLASGDIEQLPAPGQENVHEQVAIAQEYFSDQKDVPEEYIDVEPESEAAPPPKDGDAPDAPQEGKKPKATQPQNPGKQTSMNEKLAKAPTEPEPKSAPDKKTASSRPEEAPDAPKTEESTSEGSDDSTPKQAAETAEKNSNGAPPATDPQQGSLLDEGEAAEAGEAATPPASVGNETDKIADPADSPDGDGAGESTDGENFPDVILDKPKGANTRQATKKLRKRFFEAARKAGFSDAKIRSWINELWDAKSSAALQTWQVEAMLETLEG